MEPDRSRQQDPQILEREEMSLTSSTELQLFSPQRKEDQQQDNRPRDPEKKIFIESFLNLKMFFFERRFELLNIHDIYSKKTLHLHSNNFPSISTTANYKIFYFNINQSCFPHESISRLKEKQMNCDKIEFFNQTMNSISNEENELGKGAVRAGRGMKSLDYYHKKHKGRERQYAFAIVFFKDGKCEFTDAVYPNYRKEKNSASPTEVTLHSEEIIIGHIDEIILNHKTNINIGNILIYTYNSPCLKRKKNIVPCMFKLVEKAQEWHSTYGIFTSVAFSNFWGLSGPKFFEDLKYSDIPRLSSGYYEMCNKITFKLDSKDFRNKLGKSDIYRTISDGNVSDKKQLQNQIKSACNDLTELAEDSTPCLKREHLDCGMKKISSFTFHPQVQDTIVELLKKNWEELVINSFMSHVKEKITPDFNRAIVCLFLKDLQNFLGFPICFAQGPLLQNDSIR